MLTLKRYMFGKGIYLADISSKSANYCAYYTSDNTGLLLLCEAELGKPMLELTGADPNAGETAKKQGSWSTWGKGMTVPHGWEDAGVIHENLKGVMMVFLHYAIRGTLALISFCSRTRQRHLSNLTCPLTHCSIMSTSATTSRRFA